MSFIYLQVNKILDKLCYQWKYRGSWVIIAMQVWSKPQQQFILVGLRNSTVARLPAV